MDHKLQVFFDGACPLCSREIAHYRKRVCGDLIDFVDISQSAFDPASRGFDPARVHRHLHVLRGTDLLIGVDAFRAIWAVVPGFRWLHGLTGLPGVYQFSRLFYAGFALLRPYLPSRKSHCPDGNCRV